jgi:hypothetical protein
MKSFQDMLTSRKIGSVGDLEYVDELKAETICVGKDVAVKAIDMLED